MTALTELFENLKGGPGSGHHGHKGIKGKRGGSASSTSAVAVATPAPVITPDPPKPPEPPKKDPYKITVNEETEKYAESRAITALGGKAQAEEALRQLKGYVKDAPVCMRVPPDIFAKILDQGKFRNQHETGTSRGTLDPRLRAKAERNAFGYHLSAPSDFPTYGYVASGKNGFTPGASSYGGLKIEFKPEVRKRTTITAGDSLGGFVNKNLVGTPINHPRMGSLGNMSSYNMEGGKLKPGSYIEAQIHGPLKPRDIAKVYIQGKGGPHSKAKGIVDRLEKMGIPYEFVDRIED